MGIYNFINIDTRRDNRISFRDDVRTRVEFNPEARSRQIGREGAPRGRLRSIVFRD